MKVVRSILLYCLMILAMIASAVLYGFLVCLVQDMLFVPKNFMLWTFNNPGKSTIFESLAIVYLFVWSLFKRKKRTDITGKLPVVKKIKFKIASLIAFIVLFYIQISSVTVFSENRISNYSFYHPFPKTTEYHNITSVNVGIYGSSIPFIRSKGQFYYIITLNDGTKVDLMSIGGHEGPIDPYEVVEQIDGIIMDNDVTKVSSDKNLRLVTMDLVYVDCFRRILENK